MLATPQGRLRTAWGLGPDYVALWQLLEVNSTGTLKTTCIELGRHMSGPVMSRTKILRMLQKLEGEGMLTLKTQPKFVEITLQAEA